jgi:glutamate carboxypeptidase
MMLDYLAALVECESPSADLEATARCARLCGEMVEAWLGEKPEELTIDGRVHLRWRFGSTCRVALIGHLDTVWPLGTLDRWPFQVDGDCATGPGAFDMKAGVVQLFAALSMLDDLDGVTVVLTTDEEIGSPTSRQLIEDSARGAAAALVLEPSAGGALKIARKGASMYRMRVHGRAAHAGLEPERGINATVELAHQVLAATALARPDIGTTVTPTVIEGGTATNTVPAEAIVAIDVRASSVTEQERVDSSLRELAATPAVAGATVVIEGAPNRPPLEPSSSADLFALAQEVAASRALDPLKGVAVGGASDGNFTAGIGIPTLDGLGAVGDHAHAEGEWASVSAMPARAALVAGLVRRLLAG